MSRSNQAARYGALVERKARERYGLEADHSADRGVRVDAVDGEGRPFDIKGAMANRRSGAPRFRLWEDQHRYLEREDGGYVFALYVAAGRGVRVRRWRTVWAEDVELSFYGAGGHRRGASQVKVPPRDIFER